MDFEEIAHNAEKNIRNLHLSFQLLLTLENI